MGFQQLFVGEEDNGLGGNLEDGMVGRYVREVGIAVGIAQVEEGCEILVLLADGAVLELQGEAEGASFSRASSWPNASWPGCTSMTLRSRWVDGSPTIL